ncbi:spondin domain-containing protein [Flavobacteriaceae bacterium S356]|uniref:Spondin domain-containing protein n=1 Tax=Asprobacillus argus TaxID=3076534 RepID=A0ABU3LEJ7_9FLAO|nr:spondin domain-containing protein [Flavobacteriaceae bacterium S356]
MKKITLLLLSFTSLNFFGQSTATYTVTFNSIWNATDHTSVPGNAHWSRLVGATHNTANQFFQLGANATTGIKNVAEFGSNAVFSNEVNTAITNNQADQFINGPSLGTATGDMIISNLQVTEDFPLLSLISMIAPSPDWVIAINSYDLFNGGSWVTSATIDMFAYDAGTDSGSDYASGNVITSPFQPISMINGAPINGNKMGTLTITLESVLSVPTVDLFTSIKVYPNPSNGNVTINNPTSIELQRIEVYNVLGSRIRTFTKNLGANKNIDLDLNALKKGMYILKLISEDNKTKTQRLVLQ